MTAPAKYPRDLSVFADSLADGDSARKLAEIAERYDKTEVEVMQDLERLHPDKWQPTNGAAPSYAWPPAEPDEEPPVLVTIDSARRSFGLLQVEDILTETRPPDWLIAGYLELNTLANTVGAPGSGKSTLALDWCCHVATGQPWHGHRVKRRPVVYIAGEGRNGISRRLHAWQKHNQTSLEGAPLFISNQAARLFHDDEAAEVFSSIQRDVLDPPGLITVDTLARNFGGNENSSEDMGRFIDNLDIYLRQPFQACVNVVHHTGHGNQDRARGSSSLPGGVDHAYHMQKDKSGLITLRNTKMKDTPLNPDLLLKIRPVLLDLAGDLAEQNPGAAALWSEYLRLFAVGPPSAPVLVPADMLDQIGQAPLGKNQHNALKILEGLSVEYGDDCEPGELIWVPLDRWRDDCAEVGINRRRWPETIGTLQDRGLVEVNQHHARLNT